MQRTSRFKFGSDSGFLILVHSEIGRDRRIFECLVNWHAKAKTHLRLHLRQHLQLLLEKRGEVNGEQHCEHISEVGKRILQSSALVSPTRTLSENLAPIGGDTEPLEVPREDVEMRREEEATIPRARLKNKNPTRR